MKPKLIDARWPSKCKACGKAITRGMPVWYVKIKGIGVRCQDCGPHPDEAIEETKAALKRAEFDGLPSHFQPLDSDPNFRPDWMPPVQDEDGIFRMEFDSLALAVRDALSDYAQTDANAEQIRTCQDDTLSGGEWGNRFTKRKLVEQLANPDRKLMDAIESLKSELGERMVNLLPVEPRRKLRRGLEAGEDIDSDRFLAFNPNCWERIERIHVSKPTVMLAINISVNNKQEPEELLWRGAAALALADILSEQGVNVGITIFKVTLNPSSQVGTLVVRYPVKQPDRPLDLGALAFAACEIGFYRGACFYGIARHLPGRLPGGFGFPTVLPEADRKDFDYVIDFGCNDRDTAFAWLVEQVTKQPEEAAA